MCSPQLLHTNNLASGAEVFSGSSQERTARQLVSSLLVLEIRFFQLTLMHRVLMAKWFIGCLEFTEYMNIESLPRPHCPVVIYRTCQPPHAFPSFPC